MANLWIGITLSCQPQNWLLVANPEVGNSEWINDLFKTKSLARFADLSILFKM